MITIKFESKFDWFEFRRGKITGSRLKDVIVKRGSGKKKSYYEIIAERLGVTEGDEDPRERGNRLEPENVALFEQKTGKKVDSSLLMWCREDNENIAISPDGVISDTEAMEGKSLSSASHLEAFLTQSVPSEYRDQGIQYFCVNDKLETVYFSFYDPRFGQMECAFFIIPMNRKDVEEEIAAYLEYQRMALAEIESIVNRLSGF